MPLPVLSDAPAVRAEKLVKVYGDGESAVRALDGIDLEVASGAFTAIMGPSGSGKSTLMHVLAGLDSATSGRVFIGPHEVTGLGDVELTRLRRAHLGFVFQAFNLIPMMTAEQNIVLPLRLAGTKIDPDWVTKLCETMGVTDRLDRRPAEMSGGQQQRVAIARALVNNPDVVFADEPTGNLDTRSGVEVLSYLRRTVRELGRTIIMVTHDPAAAAYADDVILLADGKVAGHITQPTPEAVLAGLDALRALDATVLA